tara:strand:+ start:410 stop:1870 length:1461 start_codon:yes stop_codon:yes gene_type:complete
MTTGLEIWADSFKEGEFILDLLQQTFPNSTKKYIHGFVPTLQINRPEKINFTVYGYYDSWENRPEKISDVLVYGKPDGIIYDPKKDKIIFAYEETSAVPTGNQSLQRLERVWYAAYAKIPFVYLLSKYGLHKDGNLRKTSIWPLYLALKLSTQYSIPSLTLLYGNKKHPENYCSGNAKQHLRALIKWYLLSYLSVKQKKFPSKLLLTIYSDMCKFINSHYSEISPQLPAAKKLLETKFFKFIIDGLNSSQKNTKLNKDFKWKLAHQVPSTYKPWTPSDLFIKNIDSLYQNQKAWTPFVGTTFRTESNKFVKEHLQKQNNHKIKLEKIKNYGVSNLFLKDFKKYDSKKKIISTTKSILTLVDSTNDFLDSISKTYGKQTKKKAQTILNTKLPTTLYVSSSLHSSGRAFNGDPFTGQITAYSRVFSISLNGEKERNMVAYYPHQLYSQFFDRKFQKPDTKGVKCIEKNIDLIIARNGILINPKTWSII